MHNQNQEPRGMNLLLTPEDGSVDPDSGPCAGTHWLSLGRGNTTVSFSKVDFTKCHACHAKRRWMSPSATPATQSATASPATSASATPATRNESGCRQVPHVPRETKVDVAKCHSCHATNPISATPATQNEGRCLQVPRLPRETKVDVAKCHACHAKCRGITGDQSQPKLATRASPVP